jgi:hypothetical protein
MNTYQLFANLCESYLPEASSTLDLVKSAPGGAEVIKQLHQKSGLAHDQSYKAVDKIAWSELKDSYRGAWVIILGTNGTGAIRASGGTTGSYEAFTSTGAGIETINDSRGGNVLNFLKGNIGNLKKFYVGANTTAVKDKQQARTKSQQGLAGPQLTRDTLVTKFKPLWVKSMNSALADIKGMVGTMVKNDAYKKAKNKIEALERLENAIDAVESGNSEVPSFINSAVGSAIMMAASHHYPDATGDITRSRYGGSYETQRPEGPKQLLADIAAGDTAKLGTILGFFKRNLISG